jgi:hypothetical protein
MNGLNRSVRRSVCVVVVWALLTLAQSNRGTQAVGQVMVKAQRGDNPDPLVIDEEAENEAVVQPMNRVWIMNDEQFDQWVFGAPRNSRAGRNQLDSLLTLQVDDVARIGQLTELQKKKLVLAGRGDIKRFLEKVEEKRQKFEKVKTDQNKVGEIYQELLPLRSILQTGLFNQGSLYAKTLKTVLNDQEIDEYQKRIREKNQFRYRAKIELVVAQLDQSVGFRADQRRGFIELILSETEPPDRYGQYDYYVVLYQAAHVPAAKLEPLFEQRQWAVLQRCLNQGRGMEPFLRGQGLLPARADRKIAAEFVKALRRLSPTRSELPAEVFAPEPGAPK